MIFLLLSRQDRVASFMFSVPLKPSKYHKNPSLGKKKKQMKSFLHWKSKMPSNVHKYGGPCVKRTHTQNIFAWPKKRCLQFPQSRTNSGQRVEDLHTASKGAFWEVESESQNHSHLQLCLDQNLQRGGARHIIKPPNRVLCFKEITEPPLGWDFSHLPLNTDSINSSSGGPGETNMPSWSTTHPSLLKVSLEMDGLWSRDVHFSLKTLTWA